MGIPMYHLIEYLKYGTTNGNIDILFDNISLLWEDKNILGY